MADHTGIEWADSTWNPVVGCSIVSPGCTNCYAMRMAGRLQKINRTGGTGTAYVNHYDGTTAETGKGKYVWTGKVALAPDHIVTAPLRWKRPRRIFVNSMGDLFHESVPDAWIDRVFAIMALCPRHTFLVLTKRSRRMREYLSHQPSVRRRWEDVIRATTSDTFFHSPPPVLANAWMGVSAEDQQRANERIPDLLATPAAVRWVSAEPLIGPINFRRLRIAPDHHTIIDALDGYAIADSISGSGQERAQLDWVVVGGESGPGARPMHPQWARDIRDQCKTAGVAFYFKQWGEWAPQLGSVELSDDPEQSRYTWAEWTDWSGKEFHWHIIDRPQWCDDMDPDHSMIKCGKRRSGRQLDGVTHDEVPR